MVLTLPSAAPHVTVTPNRKVISLLSRNCNFAMVGVVMYLLWTPWERCWSPCVPQPKGWEPLLWNALHFSDSLSERLRWPDRKNGRPRARKPNRHKNANDKLHLQLSLLTKLAALAANYNIQRLHATVNEWAPYHRENSNRCKCSYYVTPKYLNWENTERTWPKHKILLLF